MVGRYVFIILSFETETKVHESETNFKTPSGQTAQANKISELKKHVREEQLYHIMSHDSAELLHMVLIYSFRNIWLSLTPCFSRKKI
jgi:hypothetical protein